MSVPRVTDTILVRDLCSGEVYRKPVVSYVDRNSENARIKYNEAYNRGIKKVIFNPPATIVYWNDNTKTVVKAINEPFDWEKGIAMAYVKKMCGNQGNYYKLFRKYEKEGVTAQGNPQEGETVEIHYDFSKKVKVPTDKHDEENTISTRNIAAEIVEEFEKVLDEHNIDIPDEDRADNPNAASLYGMTYFNLLDEVERLVASALHTMKDNPKLEIAEGVFY